MVRLLHLSDPHFGIKSDGAPAHAFTTRGAIDPSKLADLLARDEAVRADRLDAIVISGDVSWKGTSDDYEFAHQFCECLRAKFPGVSIAVVPGNHDLDRTVPATARCQDAFMDFVRRLHGAGLADYFPALPARNPANREDLFLYHRAGAGVLLAGVNSAAALHAKGTPVFVAAETLDALESVMTERPPGDRFCAFVLHHHVLPFAESPWNGNFAAGVPPDEADPTIVANSAKLQRWLVRHGFHVALHGHKHSVHARVSQLWTPVADGVPQIPSLAIGAGSAGVIGEERRPGDPLSFNVIEAFRVSKERWKISLHVRKIDDPAAVAEPLPHGDYTCVVGKALSPEPRVFAAETMDLCHEAIAKSKPLPGESVENFISIVHESRFLLPGSAQLSGAPITLSDVWDSFLALHPEYKDETGPDGFGKVGWGDEVHVARALRELPPRVQFRHGPRMFGVFGRGGSPPQRNLEEDDDLRPMMYARGRLESSSAYVGLYHPELDVGSSSDPLPALTGVQFVKEGQKLNAVATFRKIELSFWWVVNMMELIELLRWACGREVAGRRLTPGRITFFAALAEWKSHPEVTFVCKIDQLHATAVAAQAFAAVAGKAEAVLKLNTLLAEKYERTNEHNFESSGLENLRLGLAEAAPGAPEGVRQRLDTLTSALHEATLKLVRAEEEDRGSEPRRRAVGEARIGMGRALAALIALQGS